MNKLNKIYKELQLIEEFESNFNITKESKERREYLLKIINKMKIELTEKEIDRIYFTIKQYVKNNCDIDYLLEMSSDQKDDWRDELELIKKFSRI